MRFFRGAIAALLPIFILGTARAEAEPCPESGRSLVVHTTSRKLLFCEGGAVVQAFDVALGQGGVGKTREGDRRTPLGVYTLAPPRASEDFRAFLLIGYPTLKQRRLGLTGSAVGIHGPPAGWNPREPLPRDWTWGCIAMLTDDAIDAVVHWVRQHRVREVRIL